jgi:hypothetical protein
MLHKSLVGSLTHPQRLIRSNGGKGGEGRVLGERPHRSGVPAVDGDDLKAVVLGGPARGGQGCVGGAQQAEGAAA